MSVHEFQLRGLSKPKSVTITPIGQPDADFLNVRSGLTEQAFNELFKYCEGNWGEPKIAKILCEVVDSRGYPVNGLFIGIETK